jgi:hypothetical protein
MQGKQAYAGLLMFVVALSSVGFAFGQDNVQPGPGPGPGVTHSFILGDEGNYYFSEDRLYSLSDRTTYTMTLWVKLKVTIIVADCCTMGDTIALYYPTMTHLVRSATSPKFIKKTYMLDPGTYTFYVGYKACPGGFSAGYYIWFIATHG